MKAGARAYIAVAGGIDVPVVLGSRSTYALGALGGFSGRKLAAGDVLPVGAARRARAPAARLPRIWSPAYPKSLELRVRARTVFRSPDRGGCEDILRGYLDGRARSRPHRLSLSQGPRRSTFVTASSRSAPAPIPRTSSTPAIPMARCRCPAASNRSSCIATPCRAAATP